MKLKEFFETQQQQICTDVDKLELYQKFLYKKSACKSSPVKRFSFVHAKAFIYTSIVALLTLWIYGGYFIGNTNPLSTNLVQADYIAKVISFNGNFSIEHAGALYQKENISNGDTIILDKATEIVFEINSGTRSKIIWPAKLTIQKINDNKTYKLNLIYGDYIQMQGNHTPQNIELAIDDILIRQANTDKPVNFQFVNEGKWHIIKNNGVNLVVTKNGDATKRDLKDNQILAIQKTDITVFKTWSEFAKAVQKWEVSQTFAVHPNTSIKTTLTGNVTSSGENKQDSPILSFMALLAPDSDSFDNTTDNTTDNTETISQDIATVIQDQRKILSEEQSRSLRSILGAYFLSNDMTEAYEARLAGNDTSSKIRSKIKQLANAFWVSTTNDSSLSDTISSLSNILQNNYTVPPYYIDNMKIVNNRLVALEKINTGSSSREDYQRSLPDTLIFKYK